MAISEAQKRADAKYKREKTRLIESSKKLEGIIDAL